MGIQEMGDPLVGEGQQYLGKQRLWWQGHPQLQKRSKKVLAEKKKNESGRKNIGGSFLSEGGSFGTGKG